ncbi:hypothetical protein HN51_005541 [Arachis hypogaea]
MAERNELGYFTIFFRRFDDMLSFTEIKACHGLCTNVKTLSIFSILLLLFLMAVALSCVQDKPALPEKESHERKKEDDRWQVGLKKPMLRLMAVVAFNWVALFWFFWYIIDWMESEMYSGEHGKLYSVAIPLYTIGYRYGARCIMLTWVVTGLMSLAVEPIG